MNSTQKKTKHTDGKLIVSFTLNVIFLIGFITAGMYGTYLCSMGSLGSQTAAVHTILAHSPANSVAPGNLQAIVSSNRVMSKQASDVGNSKNQLMPNWESVIYNGSPERISFQKFTNSIGSMTAQFWYSVEETLHSAEFIKTQEVQTVNSWLKIIQERKFSSQSCNVLDIGSNGGYFSLLSRSVGCNVMAVDAQPWCLYRLSSSAAMNGFTDRFSITWGAVSDNPNLVLDVGATKCSGLWAVKNSEWINKESSNNVKVNSTRCVDIVSRWLGPESQDVITLMKIDAEGSEVGIIRSALPLIKSHRILHIMAEFVPDRTQHITEFPVVKDTFEQLYAVGFACKLFSHVHTLQEIINFFDMSIPMKGRGRPDMWECSIDVGKPIKRKLRKL